MRAMVTAGAVAWLLCTGGFVGNARATEVVVNGGFETGAFGSAWVHGAFRGGNNNPNLADHVVLPDLPYSGNYSALLGFKYVTQTTGATGWMYQTVTIPATASSATLNFKVRQQGYDSTPYDPFVAQIRSVTNVVLATVLNQTFPEYNNQYKDSDWLSDDNTPPVGFNMMAYAGQTVRLYFQQANTIDAQYETWAFVDDVSLVYRMWVDLIAEGNGNDVFGAMGSGAGGTGVQGGVAGDTLVYDLDVENEGTVADTYTLSLVPPVGWTAWIEFGGVPSAFPHVTPSMAAGSTRSYRVFVVPPPAAAAGTYNLILNAQSTTQPTRFDSATLRANVVNAVYGSDLVVDGNGFGVIGTGGSGGFALQAAPWGTVVTYALQLLNVGDAATTYNIAMFPQAGASATVWLSGTPYTTPFVTPSVPNGGSLAMTLDVVVPSPNLGGDYQTIIQASAVGDTLKKDTIRAVLRLQAPRVDMIIGANGDGIIDLTPAGLGGSSSTAATRGTSVYFPVVIQNESSLPDSFQLTFTGPGGWAAFLVSGAVNNAFPFTTPTVPPFSEVSYLLRLNVPVGAAFGTYPSVLRAISRVSGLVSESVSAVTSVTDASQGVDVVIDGKGTNVFGPVGTGLGGNSTQTLLPGDSVTFAVNLINLAGINSINLAWNTPAGWTVTFDGLSSPVVGHVAGVFQLKVVVPASSMGGTFDIIVDSQKSDEQFYNDSVIARVIVIPPLLVDALIDGNGNGAFGALGTGTGGASAQTTSAPAALNFTVELQNESAVSDAYTLTWNSIPSWGATMNGSPTPFTTASVAAGSTEILSFQVNVPALALTGAYSYIIDVVSVSDGTVVESIAAEVNIVGPPRADLVIDGNGTGIFGAAGSGAGGTSLRTANPGTSYSSVLLIRNSGSFPDSFFVTWAMPSGWPAGSVTIDDGAVIHAAPYWTPLIAAGGSVSDTVRVQVPAAAGAGLHSTIIDARSFLPPNSPESVRLVTQTAAVVMGVVFDDRDHDGVLSAGDIGITGVTVTEQSSGQTALTGAAGDYVFMIASGSSALVIEQNLSGFISLSPDTVNSAVLNAGDTLRVDFADVPPLRLSPGAVLNGVAGGFVDFPHRLDGPTQGQVLVNVTADSGVVTVLLFDANANGVFDGSDRPLVPADLYMNPSLGDSTVYFLLRVFVPAASAAGTIFRMDLLAVQSIEGTPLTSTAAAADAVIVIPNAIGRVTLQKGVDLGSASPGDVVTYSVSFFNAGTDSLQNMVVIDAVSPFVDPMPDAFGPGLDVEWQRQGMGPQYLTLNPADADECEFTTVDRVVRLFFSKNTPYFLQPGEQGTLTYRVVVR
jgi:uncharacterized repeat protein (TIGR01451 family)